MSIGRGLILVLRVVMVETGGGGDVDFVRLREICGDFTRFLLVFGVFFDLGELSVILTFPAEVMGRCGDSSFAPGIHHTENNLTSLLL